MKMIFGLLDFLKGRQQSLNDSDGCHEIDILEL